MAQMTMLTGPERRRRWSDEQRERILMEAFRSGARVCDVARRHDVARGLIYQCRLAALLFVFRGRIGSQVKIIWHDGLGMSLYAKRLEKGRFIWPSAKDGVVSLTASQLAYLLEGIDWRNPQYSWRPASAG